MLHDKLPRPPRLADIILVFALLSRCTALPVIRINDPPPGRREIDLSRRYATLSSFFVTIYEYVDVTSYFVFDKCLPLHCFIREKRLSLAQLCRSSELDREKFYNSKLDPFNLTKLRVMSFSRFTDLKIT